MALSHLELKETLERLQRKARELGELTSRWKAGRTITTLKVEVVLEEETTERGTEQVSKGVKGEPPHPRSNSKRNARRKETAGTNTGLQGRPEVNYFPLNSNLRKNRGESEKERRQSKIKRMRRAKRKRCKNRRKRRMVIPLEKGAKVGIPEAGNLLRRTMHRPRPEFLRKGGRCARQKKKKKRGLQRRKIVHPSEPRTAGRRRWFQDKDGKWSIAGGHQHTTQKLGNGELFRVATATGSLRLKKTGIGCVRRIRLGLFFSGSQENITHPIPVRRHRHKRVNVTVAVVRRLGGGMRLSQSATGPSSLLLVKPSLIPTDRFGTGLILSNRSNTGSLSGSSSRVEITLNNFNSNPNPPPFWSGRIPTYTLNCPYSTSILYFTAIASTFIQSLKGVKSWVSGSLFNQGSSHQNGPAEESAVEEDFTAGVRILSTNEETGNYWGLVLNSRGDRFGNSSGPTQVGKGLNSGQSQEVYHNQGRGGVSNSRRSFKPQKSICDHLEDKVAFYRGGKDEGKHSRLGVSRLRPDGSCRDPDTKGVTRRDQTKNK